MGCSHGNAQIQQVQSHSKKKTPLRNIGCLKVYLQELNFMDKCHNFFPPAFNYLTITLLNQTFTSIIHHNFGNMKKIKPQPCEMKFYINALDKQRTLSISFFSRQQLRTQKQLAFGQQNISSLINSPNDQTHIQSLDPLIQKTINIRVDSIEDVKIGWLPVVLRFTPQLFRVLTIKVNSVTLRNSSIGNRRIYIQVRIGEDIYNSVSALQNRKQIPSWSDAIHSFIVPQSLKQGHISVYEKKQQQNSNQLLGTLYLSLEAILKPQGIQSLCDQISLNEDVTGCIKFQTLKSDSQSLLDPPQMIDSPKMIKLQKVVSPRNNQIDVFEQIHFRKQISKATENQTRTNCTENRTKNSVSGRLFQQRSEAQYKKTSDGFRTRPILPPVITAPFTDRQDRQKSEIHSLRRDIQKRQSINENPQSIKNLDFQQKKNAAKFAQKELSPSSFRLNIMKTESILIKKNSSDIKQEKSKGVVEIDQFEQDNIQNNSQLIKIHKTESENLKKQPQQRFGKHQVKHKEIPLINTQNKENDNKVLSRRQMLDLKFKQIENDLQSISLQMFNNSLVCISVQIGRSEFDFSLKEQSNQCPKSEIRKDDSFELMDLENQKHQHSSKQPTDSKSFKKRDLIKDLGRMAQLDQTHQSKDFPLFALNNEKV